MFGSRWGGDLGPVLLQELQVAQLGVTELQESTYSLMATVQDTGERVQRTRAEAQELLKWVQNSWSRLEGMCLGHGGMGMGWSQGQVGGSGLEQGRCGRVRAGSRSGPDSCRGQDWGQSSEQEVKCI